MYLPLVIYAGQFDPINSGFVFKVSDELLLATTTISTALKVLKTA